MQILISDIEHPDSVCRLLKRFPAIRLETLRFSESSTLDAGRQAAEQFSREYNSFLKRGFSIHGPYVDLNPASCDRTVRQTAWERFSQTISIARALKADSVVFHSGWLPSPYGFGNWLENSSAFWRAFSASFPDIKIYVENVYERDWHLLARLADAVPGIALCFDAGHAHVYSPLPVEDWLNGLGTRMGHIHLHNNSGAGDEHGGFFDVPEGGLDIPSILHFLRSRFPSIDVVLEIPNPESLSFSMEWLACNHFV